MTNWKKFASARVIDGRLLHFLERATAIHPNVVVCSSSENFCKLKDMNNASISIKTVGQLADFCFFIPAYQRGYRWDKQQVVNLLEDISSFTPKQVFDSDEKTWYCLQPLVVKSCPENVEIKFGLDPKYNWFEAIDGQQRLTTIYLILHYLNQGYTASRRRKLFKLQYETRKESANFLETELDESLVNKSNIDFYYISMAYSSIYEWFEEKGQDFDVDDFRSKLLFSTKVLWYETEEENPISIFTRINIGKIPLTNAELVKALFLNRSNFKSKDDEKLRLLQLEIASNWDRIEYSLRRPEFWYFVNGSESNYSTHIEFILDLLAEKPSGAGDFYTFRKFSDKFKHNNEAEVIKNWEEISRCYQILEEWFEDRELYHKIGFLISSGVEINELLTTNNELSKSGFQTEIDKLIAARIPKDLDSLEYPNIGPIKRVLLLHNILSMFKNEEEKKTRFPFDRYKGNVGMLSTLIRFKKRCLKPEGINEIG